MASSLRSKTSNFAVQETFLAPNRVAYPNLELLHLQTFPYWKMLARRLSDWSTSLISKRVNNTLPFGKEWMGSGRVAWSGVK
jgi:hypothetical protein